MSRSILTRQEILDIVSRGETVYYKGRSITSITDPDIPADDSQILLDYPNWSLNPSAYASANAVGIDGYPIEGSPLNGQTLVFDSVNNVWGYGSSGGGGGTGSVVLTGDVTGSGTGTVPTTITNLALTKLASTTASRALVSNSSGKIAASSATSTELDYLSGVSSSVQTQLNGKMVTTVYDTNADGYVDNSSALKIVVHNTTGSAVAKGAIVYINGSTGTHPTIALANASSESTSSKTIGAVVAGLAIGEVGEVIVQGTLENQNTSTFAAGDVLWLSPTTPGQVTTVKPSAPNHAVFIGYVVRVNSNNGKIVYRPINGFELEELHNVAISGATNGQSLTYDQPNGLWKNTDLPYSFKTVAVSGQSDVVADSTTDTLTLVAGSNISLTTDATTDAITIAQTNSNITIAGTSTALGSSISLDTITGLTSVGNGLVKKTAANTLNVAVAGTDYVSPSVLGANSGVATLDVSGKLTSSQIPDIAVVTYLGVAANQAAMLALTGQSGDWCTRSDLGTNWVITGATPTQLSSWTQLSYPTAPVTSVNTKTGAVTLSSTDVGAQPSITANGILKGNGSGTISAATAGTDYANLAFKNIVVSGQSTVVANNAQSDLTLVAGTNITITTDATADTVTISSSASGSGTATKTLASWSPRDNNPPATNFATLDTRNSIIVLDFSAGTANKSAVFSGVIPEGSVLTSGLRVRLLWTSTSGTSGNCRWGVQFEKMTTSLDSDSFDTSTEINAAAPATAGLPQTTTLTCTTIDSLVAGDFFRLKVFRNSLSTGNDTMSGDAELIRVELRAV